MNKVVEEPPEIAKVQMPKRNKLAMKVARKEVEDIDWGLMTKKIQYMMDDHIIEGLTREVDRSIDITNKLNDLTNSLRSGPQADI